MLDVIFIVIWSAGIVSGFTLKSMMRKRYRTIHDEVFGETWLDNSPRQSWRSIKFLMVKQNWKGIDDKSILRALHITRVIVGLFIAFMFLRLFGTIAYNVYLDL